ncbi:MAG TPA: carbon-nitrogen hydrolase family protein, partial [Planctomycetota bacterium]|nr:carbon-nitrogen hydrolase family protein [Planctomycetota bacterium]
ALGCAAATPDPALMGPRKATVRIAAAQPKARLIDWKIDDPAEVLSRVDRSLEELAALVRKGAESGADVVVLPEDTLGLGQWEAAHPDRLNEVLPGAVRKMLDRLGREAAARGIYLICCNDTFEEGAGRNTAFFLGRDGRVIGRYDKVNMPISELSKKRGTGFPVFPTPDLGGVGMLICYDMVFPEAARCLALGGADIIFHPTLGGAAMGDGDVSRCAFRTRAVENFVYLVTAHRGGGSMIINPKGDVIAEAKGPDSFAIADIDPFAGREGGDAFNSQDDMRARLFRERSPEAFGIMTDPDPPVLRKVPEVTTVEEAVRVANGGLTTGEKRFNEASALRGEDARRAYERLIADYPRTWIDRVSRQRLAALPK